MKSGRPRILIIKPSSLGDIVHALPVLAALRKRRPEAHIAWLVKRRWAELLEGNADLDEILRADFSAREWPGLMKRIFLERYDWVIDLQGLLRSGILAFATGSPVRVGFDASACREPLSSLFLNRRVRPAGDARYPHIVDKNLAILSGLGLDPPGKEESLPDVRYTIRPEDERAVDAILSGMRETLIGIHPGAGHPVKCWDPERFARLGDLLVDRLGATLILFGGPDSTERIPRILASMNRKPMLAPPLTLKQLCALLRRCRVVVSADSGPLHLAAAVGAATVGLYGPSDPAVSGPRGGNVAILCKTCSCKGPKGPFINRRCGERTCIKSLEVEEVFEATRELLETSRGGRTPP